MVLKYKILKESNLEFDEMISNHDQNEEAKHRWEDQIRTGSRMELGNFGLQEELSPSEESDSQKLHSLTSMGEDESSSPEDSDLYYKDEQIYNTLIILEKIICEEKELILRDHSSFGPFFKIDNNIEDMLQFIFNPLKKPLLKRWNEIHGYLFKNTYVGLESVPSECRLNLMFRDVNIDALTPEILMYFLRAHKFIRMIVKPENLNHLINCSPYIFDVIFEQLHSIVMNESIIEFINYNFIADLLIELSRLQPACVANQVMNFNLLFCFLKYIEFPRSSDLLQMYLSPFHPEKDLNDEITTRVWKYCKCTGFFDILGMKLLHYTEVSLDNLHFKNKPYDLDVIKLTQPDLISKLAIKRTYNNADDIVVNDDDSENTKRKKKNILVEEKYVIKQDIDLILGFLDNIKHEKDIVQYIDIDRVNDNFIQQNAHNKNFHAIFMDPAKYGAKALNKGILLATDSQNQNSLDSDKIEEKSLKFEEEEKLPSDSVSILTNRNDDLVSNSRSVSEAEAVLNELKNKNVNFININIDRSTEVDLYKLNSLYPSDFYDFLTEPEELDFIDIDKEEVEENEECSHRILDLLESLVQGIEFNPRKDIASAPRFMIEAPINLQGMVKAMFDFGEGGLFKILLYNYLLKLFAVKNITESSAIRSGKLVNRILTLALQDDSVVYQYAKLFQRISRKCLTHLMKNIINLYILKDNTEINLLFYKITAHHSQAVYVVLTTFYCFLAMDKRNNYKILDQVYANVWHVIILIFFLKKWNNHIQNICYKILELVLLYGSKNNIITIVFKLNFFSLALEIVNDIDPGNETKNNCYDLLIFNLRRICKLFKSQLKHRSELSKLEKSIQTTQSWFELNRLLFHGDFLLRTTTLKKDSEDSFSISKTSKASRASFTRTGPKTFKDLG